MNKVAFLIARASSFFVRTALKNSAIYAAAKEIIETEQTVPVVKELTTKQKHKIALSIAGISLREFSETHKVSSQAIDQVASGKDGSVRLSLAIDDFIASEFKKAGFVLNNNARGEGCVKGPMTVASLKVRVSAPRILSKSIAGGRS